MSVRAGRYSALTYPPSLFVAGPVAAVHERPKTTDKRKGCPVGESVLAFLLPNPYFKIVIALVSVPSIEEWIRR